MADITVSSGQGITQAIANNLGLSKADCKKIKLSTWQQVLTLVDQNNTQNKVDNKSSIFTGSNNVNKIGDKSTYQTNFLVNDGQKIQIDDGVLSKIKQLLTGKSEEVKAETPAEINKTETSSVSQVEANIQTETVNKAAVPTSASTPSEANIVAETPLEGDVKTGEVANDLFARMGQAQDVKLSVISDDINTLMSKKDKTPEENEQMMSGLKEGFKKLGGSMTKFISSKYGDGGATISKEAFLKYQNDGLSAADAKTLENSNNIMFARMDIDGDGVISEKEMSAFYYAMDFDENNRSNGAIDSTSYAANAVLLDDPNENLFDQKLAYTYKTLYGDE